LSRYHTPRLSRYYRRGGNQTRFSGSRVSCWIIMRGFWTVLYDLIPMSENYSFWLPVV
jgi:hypothetical protein